MIKVYGLAIILLLVCSGAQAQSLRYFEFRTKCGHGSWQDSSFIAATSDQTVIDSVLTDLAKPVAMRKMISGPVASGNGGYNHNDDHWFLWHFVENQWHLAEIAAEVCDGCPYSDVDANVEYWIQLGAFCPWTSCVTREITTTGVEENPKSQDMIYFPAKDELMIKNTLASRLSVTMYTMLGRKIRTMVSPDREIHIDLSTVANGMYIVQVCHGQYQWTKKIILDR